MIQARPELCKRGEIEERSGSLQVKGYAGLDPVNAKRIYLRKKIAGTDQANGKPTRRSTICCRR